MGYDQDKWRKEKMSPIELHYLGLSEVYLTEYEDHMLPYSKIMIAKGIITEIQSDMVFFLQKNKPSDKSNQQQERIAILSGVLNYFEKVSSHNQQMRWTIRSNNVEIMKLKEQIKFLENDNKTMTDVIKLSDES
ncbi:hypothetical protein [uncultured Clostridium sp.]|uniref:hypothetical protein n=1 Tax=uncultured Clostridium sp. TaxID=59620 RepID=UPI00260A70FC|nr:hypothetical protein [uncultured Clostridium sp.]